MMINQWVKKEQLQNRLSLKTAENAFCRQVVNGTNCSSFESEIIVEKAKECFGLGQYEEGRVLLDGQIVFHAVDASLPPGIKIEEHCPPAERLQMGQILWPAVDSRETPGYGKSLDKVLLNPVCLTLFHHEDVEDYLKKVPKREIRQKVAVRLFQEAYAQGGVFFWR